MKMRILVLLLLLGITLPSASFAVAPSNDQAVEVLKGKEKVSFTLRNKSLKKIPLIIPRVMKPNLSPMSNSGVTLKEGQKILFKFNGKRETLLVVSRDLQGTKVDVAKLLRERKRALRQGDRE